MQLIFLFDQIIKRREEKGERREEFKFLAKFYKIPPFVFLFLRSYFLFLKWREEFKFLAKFYKIPPFVFLFLSSYFLFLKTRKEFIFLVKFYKIPLFVSYFLGLISYFLKGERSLNFLRNFPLLQPLFSRVQCPVSRVPFLSYLCPK